MLQDYKKSGIYFFAAYWIVNFLGFLLTVLFAAIFKPPTPQELGVPASQAPAYLMTLPYHPLLNLAIWSIFAWSYLRRIAPERLGKEARNLGLYWAAITIVLDLIGWVLIPHPWAMTLKEFYFDYQPWITLIYLIILVTPIAIVPLVRQRSVAVKPAFKLRR
jgi:hypothetical protein